MTTTKTIFDNEDDFDFFSFPPTSYLDDTDGWLLLLQSPNESTCGNTTNNEWMNPSQSHRVINQSASRNASSDVLNTNLKSQQTKSSRGPSATSDADDYIFQCVNLDAVRPDLQDSPLKVPLPSPGDVTTSRLFKTKRDQTTIPKVMFSMMKKLLKQQCPIDLRQYWKLCPFGINPRTLMDFEVPFMYAEILDKISPGTLNQFRHFLDQIKPKLKQRAQSQYVNNPGRLDKFIQYLTRVYHAYQHGINSDDRMMILYGSACKMPKATERLNVLRERFEKLFGA